MFSENEKYQVLFCIIGVWPTVYAKQKSYIFLILKMQEKIENY